MSYNGIGLQTARGTGTSGHVQRNNASIKDSTHTDASGGGLYKARQLKKQQQEQKSQREQLGRAKDLQLQEHAVRRAIEVRCMELRDELEDEELDESEIETRISQLREKLERESTRDRSPTRNLKEEVKEEEDQETKIKEVNDRYEYKSRYETKRGR
ncbi:pre-mRNA-splicing factor Cwc21p [[Candida] anglica]|uniref:Pre-mRNA-splicing factor CWC21 n=1 Tax=[Candida] anglica TaxID=148631 RepID=A0ABP0E871_9ASCO